MNVSAWWKNRSEQVSVRDLVRSEVDSNLTRLAEYWDKVKPRKDVDEIHRVDKIVYAREFAQTELPSFANEVFASQQSALSSAIPRAQFEQLSGFYNRLARIEEIQRRLRETRANEIAVHTSQAGSGSPVYEEFVRAAPWAWMEASHLIEEILTEGNPL